MSDFRYDDILNMQYPNPEIEKDFPDKILRAAQFAPFAALSGHDEAIAATEKAHIKTFDKMPDDTFWD